MSEIKQMYGILEQMIEGAESKDLKKVMELNKSYETLVPRVYHKPPTTLDLEYENCRQSCVMAIQMPNMYEKFILDAKERLPRIPKP